MTNAPKPPRKPRAPRATKPPADELRLEYMALATLKRFPGNPKAHDDAAIHGSVERFGFRDPIAIDERSGCLSEGHGRLDTLQAMRAAGAQPPEYIRLAPDGSDWLVPVVRGGSFRSKAELERYVVAHNQTTIAGGWGDGVLLAGILKRALDSDVPAAVMGFTEERVAEIIAAAHPGTDPAELPPDPGPQIDRTAELQAKWGTATGQLWEIPSATVKGKAHRLLCGDCRKPDDVARLLGGARINVAFTSPPYASQRKYDEASEFKPVPPDKYVAWFEAVATNVKQHLAPDGSWFVNIKEHAEDGERHLYVKDLTIAHKRAWGWRFVDELCWNRGGLPGSWPDRFKNGWEPVFHFSVGNRIKFSPEAVSFESSMAVTYKPGSSFSMTDDGYKGHHAHGSGMARPSNVITLPSGGAGGHTGDHPAEFPAGLPTFFIKAYSDAGDTIYEPFSGSGTTLVAAEQNARLGYGMEISAKYIAVALERLSGLGLTPRLLPG